ncbi:hypothetical protein LX03_02845 [Limosilactobacillus mucosae]|uniref:Uncharacterized protein n=1 Tax=Limosilactobacillus mucosae TaxID=97478 RepID=A0A099YCU9_LIMMU|nr:hypothetical protein LX03_02845 [Limosilactobacillus mucosae]
MHFNASLLSPLCAVSITISILAMFLKKIHIFEKKETLVLTFLKSKRIMKIVVEIIATKKEVKR